jgi:hypothetical protein
MYTHVMNIVYDFDYAIEELKKIKDEDESLYRKRNLYRFTVMFSTLLLFLLKQKLLAKTGLFTILIRVIRNVGFVVVGCFEFRKKKTGA